MPKKNIIRWRDGAGWLVLSGGNESTGDEAESVEATALARVQAGLPLAYIWAASDVETADKRLSALDDLGAPTGYLVDVLTEDDDTIRRELGNAGMIILGDGPNTQELRSGLLGSALEGMSAAFAAGAVILGVGKSAAVLGSFLDDKAGLGWIEGAIIVPAYDQPGTAEYMHSLLLKHPNTYGLGIGTGSALVLGPNGEVETWGKRQVTIKLGRRTPEA